MSEAILATDQYRTKVATAAAGGPPISSATQIAFGTGTTPASAADTDVETEILRKNLDSVTSDGVILTVVGTLSGEDAGDAMVTEAGVFDADGVLMGRRVFNPKQLEPESQLEFIFDFQF